MCDKTLPGEMQHTHRLTSGRDPTQIPPNLVQLGEPMSFIGVTHGNMCESPEMTQRQQRPTPAWVTGSQAGDLEHAAGVSFPSDSALNLFQAARLVSAPSRQMVSELSLQLFPFQ